MVHVDKKREFCEWSIPTLPYCHHGLPAGSQPLSGLGTPVSLIYAEKGPDSREPVEVGNQTCPTQNKAREEARRGKTCKKKP